MARPAPRGRRARQITMSDLSIIDRMAIESGKPHWRGWSAHQAFRSQVEFDEFISRHETQIDELQAAYAARVEESRRRRESRP